MITNDDDVPDFLAVTPPLLVSLGLILFHGGDLEDAMIETTWIATKRRRPEVVAMVRGQTMGMLKNTFLVQYRGAVTDAGLLARLSEIEARLNAAVELRNEFVHASWRAEHAKGRYPVLRKRIPKDTGQEQITAVSPEEILEVVAILEEIANAIWELAVKTAEALGEPAPEYLVRQYTDWELPGAPAPLRPMSSASRVTPTKKPRATKPRSAKRPKKRR